MHPDVVEIRGSLLFDSWFDEVPLIRNSSPEDRHLIYEGGGVILDLLLKRSSGDPCLHLGGQVLPDPDSLVNVSNVPVMIENGRARTLTRTNPIGEFMFHSVSSKDFDLTILLEGRRFVVRGLSHSDPRNWQLTCVPLATKPVPRMGN